MKKLKVLHFFKTYYPDTMGGVEQVIYQIAEGGIQFGVQSEVLYLSTRGSATNENLANHITHRSSETFSIASTGFSVSALKDFAKLAKQADVVHYHFPWPFMDILHFFAGIKKPTVVTYHSDIVKQRTLLKFYQPLQNAFLRDVDVIVASSPNYVASSSVLAKCVNKVEVVPIGIDRLTYPEVEKERVDNWRRILGERFFLFVGALRYYKGLDFLLDAAEKTGLPVVIMGAGPMEKDLRLRVKEQNLENVTFLGALPDTDKVALLSACYAFVFPSHLRSEAFGISLLEAAMFGKPLISCEIGTGTTFINIDGETGYVAAPGDSDSLAKVMQIMWDDPASAQVMGERALKRYEEKFQAVDMVKSYRDIYAKLVGEL